MDFNVGTPKITVLVLGGKGFIGRHVVARLLAQGAEVKIGTRHPQQTIRNGNNYSHPVTTVKARFEQMTEAGQWLPLLKSVDVVVNAVGILRQRPGENYTDIHHLAPVALAQACRSQGTRLVHVSALGLKADVRSRFLRSKREGDRGIQRVGGDWYIVRPSLVDGDQGYGARWIRAAANWPIHFLPGRIKSKIAAVDSSDLGAAIATIAMQRAQQNCCKNGLKSRIFELGGNDNYQMTEYLNAMRELPKPAVSCTVPKWLARLLSHLCDLLHITPFSYGHFELLQHDNVPLPNRLEEVLGRAPRRVGRLTRPASGHTLDESAHCRLANPDISL